MNDTTRNELRERVKAYLADFQDTNGYDNHDMDRLANTYAQDIIGLVTAARDAEIREAMLSDGALAVVENSRFFDENSRELVTRQIRHIGLGDGEGG